MEVNKNQLLNKIQEAKKGNQSAFNYLLDNFWGSVYNFQLQRTKNDEDAEDITIQTFSKAFVKIDSFNEEHQFKTWLIAISKNVHLDLVRKRKSSISTRTTKEQEQEAYQVADDAPTPEDKIITEQNLAKLLRDIKQLKPKYQEVINLRYFQELSYKEIATHTKEPMSNVKVKLLRAKKLLAEIIKKS